MFHVKPNMTRVRSRSDLPSQSLLTRNNPTKPVRTTSNVHRNSNVWSGGNPAPAPAAVTQTCIPPTLIPHGIPPWRWHRPRARFDRPAIHLYIPRLTAGSSMVPMFHVKHAKRPRPANGAVQTNQPAMETIEARPAQESAWSGADGDELCRVRSHRPGRTKLDEGSSIRRTIRSKTRHQRRATP